MHGKPVSYDPTKPLDISAPAGAFIAGILEHLPESIALSAAAVPSYTRLQPHRWSAAFNNLGKQDRESAVRICPVFGANESNIANKFHFEFRAADSAASPYLVLAAVVNAGLSGLDNKRPTPPEGSGDLSALDSKALSRLGYSRLSQSLSEALDQLQTSEWARTYFGETFIEAFIAHKRCEAELMADKKDAEICAAYLRAY